jgi:hypothetical protein
MANVKATFDNAFPVTDLHSIKILPGFTATVEVAKNLSPSGPQAQQAGTLQLDTGNILAVDPATLTDCNVSGRGSLYVIPVINDPDPTSFARISVTESILQLGLTASPIINDNLTLDKAQFINYGNLTWHDGTIAMKNAATLANAQDALFTIACNKNVTAAGVNNLFDNDGSVLKAVSTMGGATTIEAIFNNNGPANPAALHPSLQVQGASTITLAGGGQSTAPTVVSGPDATVEFTNGDYTFYTGAQLTGSGLVRVTNGGVLDLAGGATVTSNARFELSTAGGNDGVLQGNPANGGGTFLSLLPFAWKGGQMKSIVVASRAPGGLAISDANPKILDNTTLKNYPTATWTGTGDIDLTNAAAILNYGLFDIQNDQTINDVPGAGGGLTATSLKNDDDGQGHVGTLRKSAGAGTTTIQPTFFNNGSLQLQGHKLSFGATLNQDNRGTTDLSLGGQLAVAGGFTLINGTLSGVGTITGNLVNRGATIDLTSWPGALTVTGNFAESGGAVNLHIDGTGAGAFNAITVGGQASLGGTPNVTVGAEYAPMGGDVFDVVTAVGGRTGTFLPFTLPDLSYGRTWKQPNYLPNALRLEVQ